MRSCPRKVQCAICNLKRHNVDQCPDALGVLEEDSDSQSESESESNPDEEELSTSSELIVDEDPASD